MLSILSGAGGISPARADASLGNSIHAASNVWTFSSASQATPQAKIFSQAASGQAASSQALRELTSTLRSSLGSVRSALKQLTNRLPAPFPGFSSDTSSHASSSNPASSDASSHSRYTYRRPSSDGIGKVYMGREIAGVMSHRGAAWLERPSRRQQEHPWKIIDALALRPTDQVVDLGAGTGYMTFQLASAVPDGTVFAVDIQPEMLEMLGHLQQQRGIDNIQPVLAELTDPHVPDGIDCVLMVDAYHELEYPYEVMASIVEALKPGGQVVLAEYRGENPLIPIKRLHKMTERQAKRELESVGLDWVKTEEQLPRQHLLFFQKPMRA